MNPRVEARLEQVKRTSRAARRVCFWLMALVAVGTAVMAAAMLAVPETMTCNVNGLPQPCGDLSPGALTITLIAFVGGLAIVLVALYRLARLFQHYSRGEIFTRDSVREIRMLGYVAVAYAVFQLVLFVAKLALSAGGAVQWPSNVAIDLPIGSVVAASFILLFSWVMDVGAEIREENELTV